MRIISGVAKGRALSGVAHATRPTSDRAREALFSTLVSEFGNFDGLNFLDLYAGTGAVALEALSRGATKVHAVEHNNAASGVIESNFNLVNQSKPVGDFHLYSMPVHTFLSENAAATSYHIAFIDPPYDVSNSDVESVLEKLLPLLDPIALVAVERESKSKPFTWPTGYVAVREKNYGTASIYYGGVAS